jgi:hypothetical protein
MLTIESYWSGRELEWKLRNGDPVALRVFADLHEEGGLDTYAAVLRSLPALADALLGLANGKDCPGGVWESHWLEGGRLGLSSRGRARVWCGVDAPAGLAAPWGLVLGEEGLLLGPGPPHRLEFNHAVTRAGLKFAREWLQSWTGFDVYGDGTVSGRGTRALHRPHRDVPELAQLYGIPTEGRPFEAVKDALCEAAGCPSTDDIDGVVRRGAARPDWCKPIRMPPKRRKAVTP